MSLESRLATQPANTGSQHERLNQLFFNATVIYMLVNLVALCISLTITMQYRDDGVDELGRDF
jgi:hypothetical protein